MPEPAFRFIQVPDTHYIGQESTRDYMHRMLDRLNARAGQADFVVFTGDLSEHATEEEFAGMRAQIDRLVLPWFAIPGNHDMNREAWLRHFPEYDSRMGIHKGVRMMFLDSNEPDDSVWVTMSRAKLGWIDAQLARIAPDEPLLLFLHHPLGPDCPKYGVRNAAEVLGHFETHNLLAAVSGHYHALWQENAGETLCTTCTCLTNTRSNHDGTTAKGWREFTVAGGRVESQFVEFSA